MPAAMHAATQAATQEAHLEAGQQTMQSTVGEQNRQARQAGENRQAGQPGSAGHAGKAGAGRQSGATSPVPARPRNYLLVFERLLKALSQDYIDCARFQASGSADFMGKLYAMGASMYQSAVYCDRTLTQMIQHYLRWYQDPGLRLHVGPGAAWHQDSPIDVQRHNNELWVTRTAPDSAVPCGVRICRINGQTLEELRPEVERTLQTTVAPADPAREDWSCVLAFARQLAVVDRYGQQHHLHLVPGRSTVQARMQAYYADKGYELGIQASDARHMAAGQEAPEPSAPDAAAAIQACQLELIPSVNTQVAVLRLNNAGSLDFAGQLIAAIQTVTEMICGHTASGLVIDVRGCTGGSLDDIYPLIPWLLSERATPLTPQDIFGAPGILMNCSHNNAGAKLLELEELRRKLAAGSSLQDKASSELAELDKLAAELKSQQGKGLYADHTDYFPPASFEAPAARAGLAGPVVLLADRHTQGAGEWLARAARRMRDLTDARDLTGSSCLLAGRATAGSLDNTAVRRVALDQDFTVDIPTAKYLFARAHPTLGRGVLPHVPLTWTPEQLDRDGELAEAMRLTAGGRD